MIRSTIILIALCLVPMTHCLADSLAAASDAGAHQPDWVEGYHSGIQTAEGRPCCQTPSWGLSFSDVLPLTTGDRSLLDACIQPNIRRNWSLVGAFGYETFRDVSDQGWQNDGVYAGANFGTRMGSFSDLTGIGFQLGATLGVYDWKGNPYRPQAGRSLRQDFVTYGLFKRATQRAPFTFAVTQDWMITDNGTTYGLSLDLSQIRFRAGLVTSASNEFGVVGAFRMNDDVSLGLSRDLVMVDPTAPPDRVATTRPMNHVSAYWHHKWFNGGPNTNISIGLPENDRVRGDGSLGDFLATATVQAPLSNAVGLFGMVMYMNPTATKGFEAGHEDTWTFTIGLEFFPGKDSRTTTIAGERWMPLAPVSNNSVFLLDSAERAR